MCCCSLRYIGHMEPLRKFYMHTDEHAWEHILAALNLTSGAPESAPQGEGEGKEPSVPEVDILDPPDHLKQVLSYFYVR